MDPKPSQRSTKRSHWLLAGLMAGVAAVVAACKSSPVSTIAPGKHPGSDSPSTLGPVTQISPPSEARNPRDYRKDAAKAEDLDGFVRMLANKQENADKPMDWFLAEAHKRAASGDARGLGVEWG